VIAGASYAARQKVENHFHELAIYFMHYNCVRIHQTLRVTRPWPLASHKSSGRWMM